MLSAAERVRSRRLAAGLSQRELARRAGTSSATMSRYESGAIDPSTGTLDRILQACLPRRRRWPSLALLAPALARTLAETNSTTAWRLVGELLDDQAAAGDRDTELAVAEPPDPTGDRRVDALMGALAEHLCAGRNLAPPGWAQVVVEATPWWFVAGRPYAALALRESPPSFARRGIFITAGALERV
ncbi:MAG: helix-turn-helix domain-containing protein [Candidatus Dormibacteria bacterium]